MGITRVFFNARCGGPDRFGLWELRNDQLQSKPLPQPWSCWQPSSGGIRYGKMDFVPEPVDYLGAVSVAHPTGDFHHVSMCFDSVGWPVFATNLGLTGVNVAQHDSASTTTNYSWEGTNPVLFNNYLIEPVVENTDVIVYYTKTGDDRNLYSRYSRESYTGEYSLMEFPLKMSELRKVEVESGYFQVLYGVTEANREIKIYFAEYPEFPYFGNAVESSTGTYGFYTGEHRVLVIENTGVNYTGDTYGDSGSWLFAFVSGEYQNTIVSGSGWLADSGVYDSGTSLLAFQTGEYFQAVLSGSGSNVEETSGQSLLAFTSGEYFDAVQISSGADQTSGNVSLSFLTGQYYIP